MNPALLHAMRECVRTSASDSRYAQIMRDAIAEMGRLSARLNEANAKIVAFEYDGEAGWTAPRDPGRERFHSDG